MEQVIIYKADGNLTLPNKTLGIIVTKLEQDCELQSEDTISMQLQTSAMVEIPIGCYIKLYNRKYTLNTIPKIQKSADGAKYTIDLTFESPMYDLLAPTFDLNIDTTDNELQDTAGDSYTGNIEDFINIVVSNARRVFGNTKWYCTFEQDVDLNRYETITFGESDTCLSALQTICKTFEVEFSITDRAVFTHYINIYNKVGNNISESVAYGKGNGLYRIVRENVSNSGIITRLKAYGSTENITSKYRADRLCLPDCTKSQSYIEDSAKIAKYGLLEAKKFFDEIKPHFDGEVEAIDERNPQFFTDTKVDFDLNEKDENGETKYLLGGTAAKIHFNTGNLAGYEFEVALYNHSTHEFKVKSITDSRGMKFPSEDNSTFKIGVGNKYKIIDINLPDTYILNAEAELEEAAQKYYNENSVPQTSYKIYFDAVYLSRKYAGTTTAIFNVGDNLKIVDSELGVDKYIRISRIQRNLLESFDYTLTLSDTTTTNVITRIYQDVKNINNIIETTKIGDVAKARNNWRSSQELLNLVYDDSGYYYTDNIRPNSIQTQMLAVGAKSQQFSLDCTFRLSKDGKTLSWSNGTLVHFAIADEIKTWSIAKSMIMTLTANAPYYIYSQCQRTGTTATIVASTTPIPTISGTTHYNFLLGILSAPVADSVDNRSTRILNLTYGSTYINGRYIKTGRIQSSSSGKCYFDLDNDEIGGNITFVAADGTSKNLADVDTIANESKNYINNVLPNTLTELQKQIDNEIDYWFFEYDPLHTLAPEADWIANGTQAEHIGDLYYNTSTGAVFRYVKNTASDGSVTYKWVEVADDGISKALQVAQEAQTTADGKMRVFTSEPTTPYEVGDLWAQGITGDILVCTSARQSGAYNADDWASASKYTDNSELIEFTKKYTTEVESLQSQIDGKVETWYQSTNPASSWTSEETKKKHIGDIWYNTGTLISYYYTDTYEWQVIENADAKQAIENAISAEKLANGKSQTFLKTPTPPYNVGDLWLNGAELLTCVNSKTATQSFSANDWDKKVGYDNTVTTINGGIVTSGTIQVAGDSTNILAGMTGAGNNADSVRFWAGAGYDNRNNAPFRVLQNGQVVMNKALIEGDVIFAGKIKPKETIITKDNYNDYLDEGTIGDGIVVGYDLNIADVTQVVILDSSLNDVDIFSKAGISIYFPTLYQGETTFGNPLENIGNIVRVVNNTNYMLGLCSTTRDYGSNPTCTFMNAKNEAVLKCFSTVYTDPINGKMYRSILWNIEYNSIQ